MTNKTLKKAVEGFTSPPPVTPPTPVFGASGAVPDGSLGKNRASPPSTLKNREYVRVATASRLMSSHWGKTGNNLKGSSVLGCGRWRNYGADPNIAEIEVPAFGAPRMLGHFQCKSAWSCEHCAKGRVAQTRSWIRAALMPAMDANNLSGALLTFTLSHSYSEDWGQVVARLFDAYALFDRRMAKWYKKVGCVGKLKSLEAPIGANGLHPHLHVLMTYAKSVSLVEIEAAMTLAWAAAVAEVGGNVNEHGFDFKADCVNDYLAKFETTHELASHGTKGAKSKGKMTGQLLDRAAVGDTKAGAEWLRAMEALGGRMRFHAGHLPKKLNITCPSAWEDEERRQELDAVEAEQPAPKRITYSQHQHLKATGTDAGRAGLAIILRAARAGDESKVREVVAALCSEVEKIKTKQAMKASNGSFWDWSDDYFQEIINTAARQPLTPEQVPVYIEARIRGFDVLGMGETHVAEGVTDFLTDKPEVDGRVAHGFLINNKTPWTNSTAF